MWIEALLFTCGAEGLTGPWEEKITQKSAQKKKTVCLLCKKESKWENEFLAKLKRHQESVKTERVAHTY